MSGVGCRLFAVLIGAVLGGSNALAQLPDHTFNPSNPANPYGLEDLTGFSLGDYTAQFGYDQANEVRLMTATEFGRNLFRVGEDAFSESLHRHALFAIREVAKPDQGAEPGRAWLKAKVKNCWSHRKTLIALLQYIYRFQHSHPTWEQDAKAAGLLAGALENDH